MNTSLIEAATLPAAWLRSRSWRAVLAKSVRRRIEWITTKRRIRHEIHELITLDDRMLADIGLIREDAKNAASQGPSPTRAIESGRR